MPLTAYFRFMSKEANLLSGFVPYKLFREEGDVFCCWLDTGREPFLEPFFDETILRCRALSSNNRFFRSISEMSMLPGWASQFSSATPQALIFHLSRCGSTLLTQLLALDEQNISLSEVPFFDELLRLPVQQPGFPLNTAEEWLEAAIKFYGRPKTGSESRLFIKTDCWHIFFFETWRKLFPEVPVVLLYRSPDEVLRSQQKRRGMQSVPGLVESSIFGIEASAIRYDDFDHYFSMVMQNILRRFLEVAEKDDRVLLANYNEGMINVAKRIGHAAGITWDEDILRKMEERSRYHAKYPDQAFSGDTHSGKGPIDLDQCMRYYQQLEEKRKVSG